MVLPLFIFLLKQDNKMRDYRKIPLWKSITNSQWHSWQWQIANRITTVDELKLVLEIKPEEEVGIKNCLKTLRMAITPYYASLINSTDSNCPIRKQAVPTSLELDYSEDEWKDPLCEDSYSPVKGLTHRYPDRALFLLTDKCAVYCRHCTRRRFAGTNEQTLSKNNINACIDYIRHTPEISDVLLSGGDSLLISETILEYILKELRKISHVEIIRLGTRLPVVLPQRITEDLVLMLKKYHPIYINTHFNHPDEITKNSSDACNLLADNGFPLGNQTVLLNGINNCPVILKKLMKKLLTIRVRPYYLHQCDMSEGIQHFRTPVSSGIEAIEFMRGHISGLAVPHYVIDTPGGGGKAPLIPNYLISQSQDGKIVLRNYEGKLFTYNEGKKSIFNDELCPICGKKHENKCLK